MNRDDQRDPVIHLGQNSAKMRVPGMAMDDVRVRTRGIEVGASAHSAKHRD